MVKAHFTFDSKCESVSDMSLKSKLICPPYGGVIRMVEKRSKQLQGFRVSGWHKLIADINRSQRVFQTRRMIGFGVRLSRWAPRCLFNSVMTEEQVSGLFAERRVKKNGSDGFTPRDQISTAVMVRFDIPSSIRNLPLPSLPASLNLLMSSLNVASSSTCSVTSHCNMEFVA